MPSIVYSFSFSFSLSMCLCMCTCVFLCLCLSILFLSLSHTHANIQTWTHKQPYEHFFCLLTLELFLEISAEIMSVPFQVHLFLFAVPSRAGLGYLDSVPMTRTTRTRS